MGLDNLLKEIDKLEQKIKEIYGKKSGRVKIENARTLTSYSINKNENFMKWYIEYLNNLKNLM